MQNTYQPTPMSPQNTYQPTPMSPQHTIQTTPMSPQHTIQPSPMSPQKDDGERDPRIVTAFPFWIAMDNLCSKN